MKRRTLSWALIFCVIAGLFPATAFADAPTQTVTLLEIPDAIAPINGQAPVTTIAETEQYTGVVAWSDDDGNPVDLFEPDTTYIATITLTAKEGYTLTGVAENAFKIPCAMAATNEEDSGEITATFVSPPEGYITDGHGVMAYAYTISDWYDDDHETFDIKGFANGAWQSTTFDDHGYTTEYEQDEEGTYIVASGNPELVGNTGLTMDIDLVFVSEGRALQVRYTLNNPGASAVTLSFGTNADIQIGSDDDAPIEVFGDSDRVRDNRGFKMYTGSTENGTYCQFNFFGKRSVGVTDVDTFWYGYYGDRYGRFGENHSEDYGNQYVQVTEPSFSGDSALAYSWKDRVIGPGETQIYSVVIGIGGVGSEEVVGHDDDTTDVVGYCSFVVNASAGAGGSITPSGAVVVEDLSNVSFTITPDPGYTIKDLLVDGISVGPASTFVLQTVRYNRTVQAVFEPLATEVENPFVDVTEDDWFFESVLDAYHRGLLLGTGDGLFEPNAPCTRAMIPTIIYRMESSPDIGTVELLFSDVVPDQWYMDGLNWAAQHGVVLGIGENLFAPDLNVTREQLAAMFYRYAQYKGWDVSAVGDLSVFADEDEVSSWALEAVKWAVGKGLLQGRDNGLLDPLGVATRAELAAFLSSFVRQYNPNLDLAP